MVRDIQAFPTNVPASPLLSKIVKEESGVSKQLVYACLQSPPPPVRMLCYEFCVLWSRSGALNKYENANKLYTMLKDVITQRPTAAARMYNPLHLICVSLIPHLLSSLILSTSLLSHSTSLREKISSLLHSLHFSSLLRSLHIFFFLSLSLRSSLFFYLTQKWAPTESPAGVGVSLRSAQLRSAVSRRSV